MKILLVAHPDDERLRFNPLAYDKIIIVFTDRDDAPWFGEKSERSYEEVTL